MGGCSGETGAEHLRNSTDRRCRHRTHGRLRPGPPLAVASTRQRWSAAARVAAPGGVEVGGRFVGEQDRRVVGQGARQLSGGPALEVGVTGPRRGRRAPRCEPMRGARPARPASVLALPSAAPAPQRRLYPISPHPDSQGSYTATWRLAVERGNPGCPQVVAPPSPRRLRDGHTRAWRSAAIRGAKAGRGRRAGAARKPLRPRRGHTPESGSADPQVPPSRPGPRH